MNIKKILFIVFSGGIIFSSLLVMVYIAFSILINGNLTIVEPNLFILILEIIWCLGGLVSFPFLIHLSMKETR